MRLAELSTRSGVSTATIKYYLREGLLPPGRRVTATQSEYDEGHLQRLRLVRALIQVGRVPIASAREVLTALEDESLDRNSRLGTAVWALPHGPQTTADDAVTDAAGHTVDALLRRLGWANAQAYGADSPAYRMLVTAVGTLSRLGYPCAVDDLAPYARSAGQLAVADLDLVERYESPDEQLEAAVALTVLYEPVLLALRRMAQTEESNRRYGQAGSQA
ncbi:MerR family transcriptional regulator [Streptomyces sp. NBC_01381]|uniref:MerR family transcriptional regulator n=1 Tax=Streptomyces sp. NBC_01381 TaxID=2903845 RepID=UPI00224E5E51|nr:MerR family transcriptional regulator [Streptomyces sp. NBC_01381]MCX4670259.1 MerR family transcriptional regulator [Streptomyces sp. NBC_01381]